MSEPTDRQRCPKCDGRIYPEYLHPFKHEAYLPRCINGDWVGEMKLNPKTEKVAFEFTRAEYLRPAQRKEIGYDTGLVAIEKRWKRNEHPTLKLHYIGARGMVYFIKQIEVGLI